MNMTNSLTNKKKGISWQDWLARNRLQDLRGVASRAKLTKLASIAVLLMAVLFWGSAPKYQILLWFVVCAGASRVALLAGAARRYDWAILFTGVALLYNPIFPVFALTGRPAYFLVIASIAAFTSSLFLLKPRLVPSVAGR